MCNFEQLFVFAFLAFSSLLAQAYGGECYSDAASRSPTIGMISLALTHAPPQNEVQGAALERRDNRTQGGPENGHWLTGRGRAGV
jgi:hypothetical protein